MQLLFLRYTRGMVCEKEIARSEIQSRVAALTQEDYLVLSSAVQQHIRQWFSEYTKQRATLSVLLYSAIHSWREVDISWLAFEFPQHQYIIALPHRDAPISRQTFDIIFVPLFGMNSENYRLGHGAGWYDKMLQSQPAACKVGVGFELSRINFRPQNHDIPMDVIFTEVPFEQTKIR